MRAVLDLTAKREPTNADADTKSRYYLRHKLLTMSDTHELNFVKENLLACWTGVWGSFKSDSDGPSFSLAFSFSHSPSSKISKSKVSYPYTSTMEILNLLPCTRSTVCKRYLCLQVTICLPFLLVSKCQQGHFQVFCPLPMHKHYQRWCYLLQCIALESGDDPRFQCL